MNSLSKKSCWERKGRQAARRSPAPGAPGPQPAVRSEPVSPASLPPCPRWAGVLSSTRAVSSNRSLPAASPSPPVLWVQDSGKSCLPGASFPSTPVPRAVCTVQSRLLPAALVFGDGMSVLPLTRGPAATSHPPPFCPHSPRVHSPRPARVKRRAAPSPLAPARPPRSGWLASLPAPLHPRWPGNQPPPSISSGDLTSLLALKAGRLPVT